MWSGQAVSTLGDEIASIAYPLLVLATTGSPTKAGLVGFAFMLPFVVLQLPAGALVDRWDRKRTMIACDVGRAAAVASLVVALVADRLTFAHVLVVVLVQGTLYVPWRLAESAAVKQVVTPEQLPDAVAQSQGRIYAATLIGPPIGGVLFELGRSLPFVADVVSYVVSIVSLLLMKARLQEPRVAAPRRLHVEVREGFAWFWRQPFIRTTSFLASGSDFVINALFLVLIVAAQRRGATPTEIGVMVALLGGGGVVGAVAAPWLQRRIRSPRLIVVGAPALGAVMTPLIAVAPNAITLGLIAGVILSVWPVWNAVITARVTALIPDDLQGRVHSARTQVLAAPAVFSALSAGVLLDAAGVTTAVVVYFFAMAAVVAAAALSRSVRAFPLEVAAT